MSDEETKPMQDSMWKPQKASAWMLEPDKLSTEPNVHVIINNKDYGRFLPYLIKSIKAQNYPTEKILVAGIDAGSTDNSIEVFEKFNIPVLQTKPGSQPKDLNKVIPKLNCEYFTWINSDDLMLENFVRDHLKAFLADPEVGMVYGPCLQIDIDGQMMGVTGWVNPNPRLLLSKGHNVACHPGVMIRKKHFMKAGNFFDERWPFAYDFDVWCRMAIHSRLVCLPTTTAVYRYHTTSMFWSNKDKVGIEHNEIVAEHRGKIYYGDRQ